VPIRASFRFILPQCRHTSTRFHLLFLHSKPCKCSSKSLIISHKFQTEWLCTWLSKSAIWDLARYQFLLVSKPMIQPECGGIKNMKSHVLPSISKINLQRQDTHRPKFIGWWSINTSLCHFIFQSITEIKMQCKCTTNILWWGYPLPEDLSLKNEKTWCKRKN